MIEGVYDGVLFPRHLTPNSTFRVYRKAFCRALPILFDHHGKSPDGFRGVHFKMDDGAFDTAVNNEANQCYCKKNNKCLPKGFSDITPCYYGIPTAVSQPHFLNAAPSVWDKISGLTPNREAHDIFLIFHPVSFQSLTSRKDYSGRVL